ncbi:MAG: DUF3592 domain-containing protein [Kiritimatiellae bacterium]|nr:DUF3592 domain-containing protein [Kiritimatiellia bacterium]
MSKPRNVSNKSRRLQICLVLIASVVGISAIIFVACQERFVFILPGLVFLVASFATIMLFCQVYCELRSRRWPMAVGLIRSAGIVRSYMPSGGKWDGNSPPPHAYTIVVEYNYSVADKQYKGTRVSFVEKDYASWKEADVARRRFMQDKKINVYYCPLIPSLSCITHLQLSDIMITVSVVVAFNAVLLIVTLLAFYYLP